MKSLWNKKMIFLFILIFLVSCATTDIDLFKKKPEVDVDDVDIIGLTFQDITLKIDLDIENPYPVNITLDKIVTRFMVEDKQLFETSSQNQLQIPAKDDARNSFNVVLKFMDIINIIKDYSEKESLDTLLTGDLVFAIPETGIPGVPQSVTIPYDYQMTLPTIKPTLMIKNFTIEPPSKEDMMNAIKESGKNLDILATARFIDALIRGNYGDAFRVMAPENLDLKFDVGLVLELKNMTKAAINLNAFDYNFIINASPLLMGEATDIKTDGNSSLITMNNQISSRNFTKSLITALKNKVGNFELTGKASVELPSMVRTTPVELTINEKGSVKIE